MTAPPGLECGDVISIFNYQFDDGSVADSKYFVIMGYHLEQALGFITTSKEKGGRTRKEGCHLEYGKYPSNYYMTLKDSPFHDGTWVLLDIQFIMAKTLSAKLQHGGAVRVYTLPPQHVHNIRKCFENTPECAPVYLTALCG